VVTARKGRATWQVKVSGCGAHAGSEAARGANAIQQLALLIPRITALNDSTRALTVNVANISGGAALNRVPHEAVAEGEFRAFDSTVYDETRIALLAMAGTGEVVSETGDFACKIHVDVLTESASWPPNEASRNLASIWQKNAALLGMDLGEQHRGGLSDGNQLWDYLPTLDGLGPWGAFAHCSEWSEDGSKIPEFVDLTHFVPKATLNVLAILDLLGVGSD
jgi:glutamate carboxypeptidase